MGVWVDNPSSGSVSNLPAGETAHGLVADRFDLSSQYIGSTEEKVLSHWALLQELLSSLQVPSTSLAGVDIPDVPDLDISGRPSVSTLDLVGDFPETVPTAPSLNTVSNIEPVTIPVMSVSPPTWNTPEKPSLEEISSPGDAPQLATPELPASPSINWPDAPVLQDIVIPGPPNIAMPVFDAEFTETNIHLPEGFSWEESPYNSEIWNDLLTKARDGIVNGGTGLGPDIEQAIWDRAQSRLDVAYDQKIREIEEYWSSKNYGMPPGALSGALLELYGEITRSNEDLTKDIAVEQARLAHDYSRFIQEHGRNLEATLREFHNAQENRSIESAKNFAASAISIHNALADRERLRMEVYQTRATVYETQVKAALEGIELYKAQIEGLRVSAEVQKQLVDIYEVQLNAVEQTVKVYTAQMEGARLESEMNKLLLEQHKQTVEVYLARLQAQETEFKIYATEMDGEKIKAQTFSEQMRGYLAEVEAVKAQSDIRMANLDAQIRENGMLIEAYKSELSGYEAEVRAASMKIGAEVDGFKAEVAAYSAETEASGMEYGARIKHIDAKIHESEFHLRHAIAEIEAATNGYLGVKELQVKGTEGMLNVAAQLMAAALNAVNASATLSAKSSVQESDSRYHTESLRESHGYQHE